jgi:hypothetical protein
MSLKPVYIFSLPTTEDASEPPSKRRKIGKEKRSSAVQTLEDEPLFTFVPLLDGLENPECVALRQRLFEQSWGQAERRIQDIMSHANNDTLVDVTSFIQETTITEYGLLQFQR